MNTNERLDYEAKRPPRLPRHWRWISLLFLFAMLIPLGMAGRFLIRRFNQSQPVRVFTYHDQCLSNLSQIKNAIILYSNEFGPHLPDSLGVIAANEEMTGHELVCFETNDTTASGPTTRALADDMDRPGHCSYVFLGGGQIAKNLPADAILVYEPIANHPGEMMVAVFADGHVARLPAAAERDIKAQVAAGISPVRWSTTQPSTQP